MTQQSRGSPIPTKETETKNKSDHSSNNKVKLFCENIVVIEEEWFADANLTDGEKFPRDFNKWQRHRINF